MHIKIKRCDKEIFSWKIPCFPVVSVLLRKVRFEYVNNQGVYYDGVLSTDKIFDTGFYICTSFCEITMNGKTCTVLWTFEETASSDLGTEQDAREQEYKATEVMPHALLFKVMGICYTSERQNALERAYKMLYDFNRPLFVQLFLQNQKMRIIQIL